MILLLALVSAASAGSHVQMDDLTVNGLEVQSLTCDLGQGGFFAVMDVVSTLASKKADLDACAPTGAAMVATWTWDGKATKDVAIGLSTSPQANACVAKALGATDASKVGTCTATLLVGDLPTAQAAANQLRAKPPAAASVPPAK